MSAELTELVEASVRGDRQAFGRIVERYQGVVSAMAYSVTGDFGQSEDLAQETFLVAWQKLKGLRKQESLAAWLCGIARNLARDWLRRQAKTPTVPLDKVSEPGTATPEDGAVQRERAETVWAALQGISETYREPLVLFYRQDHSVRDIADALALSEDCVKQRLSRGRKMLREEVTRMVEDTLEESRPGKAFTAGVLAALPPLGAARIPLGTAAAKAVPPAASLAGVGAKLMALAAAVVLIALGGLWGVHKGLWGSGGSAGESVEVATAADGSTQMGLASQEGGASGISGQPTHESPSGADSAAGASAAGTATAGEQGSTISGMVVFRDSGDPAPGMRVLFGTNEAIRKGLSDEEGRFAFNNAAPGEFVLLAYDARYEEVPEDWLRSEHIPVLVKKGEDNPDIRIEVPPQGGEVRGRVYDKATGKPVAGITVSAGQVGKPFYSGKSGSDGQYTVLGLTDGAWRMQLDRGNPVFVSGFVNTMPVVSVKPGESTTLDFPVDMGIAVRGQVLSAAGEPVAEAIVDANRFLTTGEGSMSCYFRSDDKGRFCVWGALPGEEVVLKARKDEEASHIAVVKPVPEKAVDGILLTLQATVKVSGRFVDEQGRPVKAVFWWCPVNADGRGVWHGQGREGSTTFGIALAPGDYEVKGQPEGNDFGVKQIPQKVQIGSEPLANLTISVVTKNEMTGDFALRGKVVDEQNKPLRGVRVYVDGAEKKIMTSFQETYTDAEGRFSFKGLQDARYRVHATPSEPFEKFAGFDGVNPAETPEVTIVARLAAKLAGRVVDARTGKPITKFTIEHGEDLGWRQSAPEKAPFASDAGAFALPMRLDRDWYARVIADGYAPLTKTGTALASGETVKDVEFRLPPSRVVRGVVVDEAGEAVAGALLFQTKNVFDHSKNRARYADAQSDAEGRFELGSIPETSQFVYAKKEGYTIAQAPVADEVRLVLTQGGAIEGRILLGGAAWTGKARVIAKTNTGHLWSAQTDESGTYRLSQLMDASYRLWVSVEDENAESGRTRSSYYLQAPVEAANGLVVTYDIDLPLGNGVVEGVVTRDGAPVPKYTLTCTGAGYMTFDHTDETGCYCFEGLPAGHVQIGIRQVTESGAITFPTIFESEIAQGGRLHKDLDLSEFE